MSPSYDRQPLDGEWLCSLLYAYRSPTCTPKLKNILRSVVVSVYSRDSLRKAQAAFQNHARQQDDVWEEMRKLTDGWDIQKLEFEEDSISGSEPDMLSHDDRRIEELHDKDAANREGHPPLGNGHSSSVKSLRQENATQNRRQTTGRPSERGSRQRRVHFEHSDSQPKQAQRQNRAARDQTADQQDSSVAYTVYPTKDLTERYIVPRDESRGSNRYDKTAEDVPVEISSSESTNADSSSYRAASDEYEVGEPIQIPNADELPQFRRRLQPVSRARLFSVARSVAGQVPHRDQSSSPTGYPTPPRFEADEQVTLESHFRQPRALTEAVVDTVHFSPQALKPPREGHKARDPQIFTFLMNERGKMRDMFLDRAREKAEYDNRSNKEWVPIPKLPGAYYDRPIEPWLQEEKEKWRDLNSALAMFERARKIAPRNLLEDMALHIAEGERGEPSPDSEMLGQLRIDYDYQKTADGRQIQLIKTEELDWFKFVTSGSSNRKMMNDLPSEENTMYLAFAERLQHIMEDTSEAALFPTAETRVPLAWLLEVMHRGADHPTNAKAKFSLYDANCWLKRLSDAGRCIRQEDIEDTCHVLRPALELHPEHQISLHVPLKANKRRRETRHIDNYIAAPWREGEVEGWKATVDSGRPWKPLNSELLHFFRMLAFRVGYTHHYLKTSFKSHREAAQPVDPLRLEKSRQVLMENFREMAGLTDPDRHLRHVLERAKPENGLESNDDEACLYRIRRGLVEEAYLNRPPLYPQRQHWAFDETPGAGRMRLKRPSVWQWAKPEVCGEAPQYFSLDRWPTELQTPETAKRLRGGADGDEVVLDPAQVWDPCAEDGVGAAWVYEEPRIYGDEPEVRVGRRDFYEGDTVLQREQTEMQTTAAAYLHAKQRGYIPDDDQVKQTPTTFRQKLANILSWSGSAPQEPPAESTMPDVDPDMVPRSVDWKSARSRKRRRDDDEDAGRGRGSSKRHRDVDA